MGKLKYSLERALEKRVDDSIEGYVIDLFRRNGSEIYAELEQYLTCTSDLGSKNYNQMHVVTRILEVDKKLDRRIAKKMSDNPKFKHRSVWTLIARSLGKAGFEIRQGVLVGYACDFIGKPRRAPKEPKPDIMKDGIPLPEHPGVVEEVPEVDGGELRLAEPRYQEDILVPEEPEEPEDEPIEQEPEEREEAEKEALAASRKPEPPPVPVQTPKSRADKVESIRSAITTGLEDLV